MMLQNPTLGPQPRPNFETCVFSSAHAAVLVEIVLMSISSVLMFTEMFLVFIHVSVVCAVKGIVVGVVQ